MKFCTKVNSTATMPQVTMIRASQRRAPNWWRARLLGHLEQDVAEEEDPRGEPELGGGQAEAVFMPFGAAKPIAVRSR